MIFPSRFCDNVFNQFEVHKNHFASSGHITLTHISSKIRSQMIYKKIHVNQSYLTERASFEIASNSVSRAGGRTSYLLLRGWFAYATEIQPRNSRDDIAAICYADARTLRYLHMQFEGVSGEKSRARKDTRSYVRIANQCARKHRGSTLEQSAERCSFVNSIVRYDYLHRLLKRIYIGSPRSPPRSRDARLALGHSFPATVIALSEKILLFISLTSPHDIVFPECGKWESDPLFFKDR